MTCSSGLEVLTPTEALVCVVIVVPETLSRIRLLSLLTIDRRPLGLSQGNTVFIPSPCPPCPLFCPAQLGFVTFE